MKRPLALELVLSSHPEPVAAVTVIAGFLALLTGRGVLGTLSVVATVLCGQLSVGWTNDYVDRERDAAAGRQDKPVATGRIEPRVVRAAAYVAGALCILLSLTSGLGAAVAAVLALAVATAYNLVLKQTVLSVLAYAIAFPLMVVFLTAGMTHRHLPPFWAVAAAALLASGAHFTQVLPDIESDRPLGTLGLPQRIGAKASSIVAPLLLAGAALVVGFGPGSRAGIVALVVVGIAIALAGAVLVVALSGRLKLAFHLTIATAAAIGAGFVAAGRTL